MSTPAERYAAAKLRGKHPITTDFLLTFEFEFDPFQVAACHAVEEGKGVLVAAPTGAGKTVVGEFAAYYALQAGKKCFYTTPIKALSNQKYSEFVAKFGEDRVGLLTGDTSINGDAEILVMTTEVFDIRPGIGHPPKFCAAQNDQLRGLPLTNIADTYQH